MHIRDENHESKVSHLFLIAKSVDIFLKYPAKVA